MMVFFLGLMMWVYDVFYGFDDFLMGLIFGWDV